MDRFIVVVIVLSAWLCACEDTRAPISGDISGLWHGARWDGRTRVLWLSDIQSDGQLRIQFLTCFNGELLSRQRQEGVASLIDGMLRIELDSQEHEDLRSGDIITTDGFDHDYEITELGSDLMRYRSEEFGERYEVSRVADDFDMVCPPATISVRSDPGDGRQRDAWIIRRGWLTDEGEEEQDATDAAAGAPPGDSATEE